jgi:hypothetical protein
LLELITFGFYRFWLTTDIRRHLWSHTEIDGSGWPYAARSVLRFAPFSADQRSTGIFCRNRIAASPAHHENPVREISFFVGPRAELGRTRRGG